MSSVLFEGWKELIIIALPPLIFSVAVTFCASVYLRSPVIIVPMFLIYMLLTTVSQAAADAVFSWISPIVRPEYFDRPVPLEWLQTVIIHQVI